MYQLISLFYIFLRQKERKYIPRILYFFFFLSLSSSIFIAKLHQSFFLSLSLLSKSSLPFLFLSRKEFGYLKRASEREKSLSQNIFYFFYSLTFPLSLSLSLSLLFNLIHPCQFNV